jgi:hypothetical protein
LNLAVACAAVCWMLYGWLPPRWALLGAILAVLNISLLRHWGQSYWGGGVALLGGALLFGSLPRLQREPRLVYGLLIGIGLSLLANSRPYESLIAVLPAAAWRLFAPQWPPGAERGSARGAAWFGWQLLSLRRRIRENGTGNAPNSHEFGYGSPDRGLLLRRVIAPAAAVLLLTGAWMALYNYRVTRDPLRLPYQVWQETYTTYGSVADIVFFWRTRTIPEIEPQRRLRKPVSEPLWEIWFERQANLGRKLFWQWQFYVTLTLTLPLLAVPWACRRGWPLFAAVTVGLVIVAVIIQGTHGHAHYVAPVACLISLLLVQGLRWWRCWRRNGRPAGVFLVRAMLALHVFSVVFVQGSQWVSQPLMPHQRWALEPAERRRTPAEGGWTARGDRPVPGSGLPRDDLGRVGLQFGGHRFPGGRLGPRSGHRPQSPLARLLRPAKNLAPASRRPAHVAADPSRPPANHNRRPGPIPRSSSVPRQPPQRDRARRLSRASVPGCADGCWIAPNKAGWLIAGTLLE